MLKKLPMIALIKLGILGTVVVIRVIGGEIWGNVLLIIGWMAGDILGGVEHFFKGETAEQVRLAMYNLLTVAILTVLGLWLVTSSSSLLASGMVVGLSVKLFADFARETDYHKWYWQFAKNFDPKEHRLVKIVWGVLLLLQIIWLLRI